MHPGARAPGPPRHAGRLGGIRGLTPPGPSHAGWPVGWHPGAHAIPRPPRHAGRLGGTPEARAPGPPTTLTFATYDVVKRSLAVPAAPRAPSLAAVGRRRQPAYRDGTRGLAPPAPLGSPHGCGPASGRSDRCPRANPVRSALAACRPRGWPPGELSFSLRRTRAFESEPLPILLASTSATARCSRSGCSTCRSCSRSDPRRTTTSPSPTRPTSAGATARWAT